MDEQKHSASSDNTVLLSPSWPCALNIVDILAPPPAGPASSVTLPNCMGYVAQMTCSITHTANVTVQINCPVPPKKINK